MAPEITPKTRARDPRPSLPVRTEASCSWLARGRGYGSEWVVEGDPVIQSVQRSLF